MASDKMNFRFRDFYLSENINAEHSIKRLCIRIGHYGAIQMLYYYYYYYYYKSRISPKYLGLPVAINLVKMELHTQFEINKSIGLRTNCRQVYIII